MLELLDLLIRPTLETVAMVAASTLAAVLLGAPVGLFLYLIAPGGLSERPALRRVLDRAINALRSFPFIILMIMLFPLSRILIGTSIGTAAAIVPLAIAAAPFVARLVESALSELDRGVVDAAVASGATKARIALAILLPEALPSLVSGLSLTVINLIGYSAMAGAIGGGGLGDLAVRFGYHRFRLDVMTAAVLVILVLVEGAQAAGNAAVRRIKSMR
ncbi:MAG TPA: methionine ABC transporter permease [Spirochaetales bacterium]|nr:methionine ABC transporter permease [Spirochaetales bacterium]HPB67098.1 methionine ABC transporter permease [Spirochaetales bacterium]HPG87169.1 methionine ABC transporter permease [Spirochaetales bacterium]HPM72746.1 methionine ABC transporter permease [Spirochaetales bacterium]